VTLAEQARTWDRRDDESPRRVTVTVRVRVTLKVRVMVMA
jgi:hypothetical protein